MIDPKLRALLDAADQVVLWVETRHTDAHDIIRVEIGPDAVIDWGECDGCLRVAAYHKRKEKYDATQEGQE